MVTQPVTNTDTRVEVKRSFYMTFNGKRSYCHIPNLLLGPRSAKLTVKYEQGDEEHYFLVSEDGLYFTGAVCTEDDNRVIFRKWISGKNILLAGSWKCGGREGEWYIEGELCN
jgi:hypothetical protein